MEPNEDLSYLQDTIRTHFKRRLFKKLHELLFEAAKNVKCDHREEHLKHEVFSVYQECLQEITFSQGVTIFQCFLQQDFLNNVLTLELFPTFFLHLKINDHVIGDVALNDFKNCVEKFRASVAAIEDWSEMNDVYLCKVLKVLHAFGSIRCFQVIYDNLKYEYCTTDSTGNVLNFYGENFANLDDILTSKVKYSSYDPLRAVILNLWCQKAVLLGILRQNSTLKLSSEEDQKLIKSISDELIKTPYLILQVPFQSLIQLLNRKQICSLVKIILANVKSGQNWALLLRSEAFHESYLLQTAVVHAVCNELKQMCGQFYENIEEPKEKDWIESCRTTPKTHPDSSVWQYLKKLAKRIRKLDKTTDCEQDDTANTVLLAVTYAIPLGSLLPVNQTRILLALCPLFFHCDSLCNETKKTLVDCFIGIFGGSRGCWFFDIVSPSTFLKQVFTSWGKALDINIQKLILLVLDRAFRRPDVPTFFLKVQEYFRDTKNVTAVECFALIETITKVVDHPKLKATVDDLVYCLVDVLLRASENLENGEITLILITKGWHTVLKYHLQRPTLDVVKTKKQLGEFFEISMKDINTQDEELSKCRFALISLAYLRKDQLQEILPSSIWKNCMQMFMKDVNGDTSSLDSRAQPVAKRGRDDEKEEAETCAETSEIIPNKKARIHLALENPELNSPFFESCSRKELKTVIEELTAKINSEDASEWHSSLCMWNGIMLCRWLRSAKENKKVSLIVGHLNLLLPRLLHILHLLEMKTDLEYSERNKIVVLLFKFLRAMLHNCQNALTSHKVSLCLEACALTSMEKRLSTPGDFVSLYNSIYEVLNEILLHHKVAAVFGVSVINGLASSMLSCLMRICKQEDYLKYSPDVINSLQKSAANFERLTTALAQLDDEYVLHAPHLVAVYATEVQNVTVHEEVRSKIVYGLYRLLNVMKVEDKFEFVHSRLNQSGRQVFKLLYANYEKFYKYKGDV